MARSSYIYIVYQKGTGDTIGAFTVKHEMLSFVKRCAFPVYCLRYRDGQTPPDETQIDLP